jgi:hypothetical protein
MITPGGLALDLGADGVLVESSYAVHLVACRSAGFQRPFRIIRSTMGRLSPSETTVETLLIYTSPHRRHIISSEKAYRPWGVQPFFSKATAGLELHRLPVIGVKLLDEPVIVWRVHFANIFRGELPTPFRVQEPTLLLGQPPTLIRVQEPVLIDLAVRCRLGREPAW